MGGPAEILVIGQRDTFVADDCAVTEGAVSAVGRWRFRYGPNNRLSRFSEPVARTWPVCRVVEIRWQETRAAA